MKSLVLIIILAIGFTACSGTYQIHSPEGHGFYLRAGLVKPTGMEGIFIVQGMDVNGRIIGPRYRARFLTTPHVGDCVLVCREQVIEPKF